ncbi:complex I NDUFA9 subunit family protein [Lichenibacterium minor]|uniref:Complex I NDUFA9 subunit family protein n=1 Tax=Lichenibacterium minor TaxID=2316528 RepID=A0A4Q2U263_9HYPH|nr:complex I NDUFA9 subunit family protein [Lichenibacterium minor]RYC30573.1 complex I NDUFA9 subunit family protein [Lichenibacterium minor]
MAGSDLATNGQVTVFGASGFLGRHVVRALARAGFRVMAGCRRPDLANYLQPLGRVGQIQPVQTNVRYPESLAAALRHAEVAVNLVGILSESGDQTFEAVHVEGARAMARAARDAGVRRFVQVSAIGADAESNAVYGRTKARAEAAVRDIYPDAVILRPSIVFGPEDDFFNRFAAMARFAPALPLVGGGHTRFQPVFVGDVADAVALAAEGGARAGTVYELGGPSVRTFKELMEYVLATVQRSRPLVSVPFGAMEGPAALTERLSGLMMGLFPKTLLMTRDQLKMLGHDNVVSAVAVAEGRTLQGLGNEPRAMESVVPSYLYRFRKHGQFDRDSRLA